MWGKKIKWFVDLNFSSLLLFDKIESFSGVAYGSTSNSSIGYHSSKGKLHVLSQT